MVVQHNLQAMNSNRMLGITTKTVASSTEKLSSGYRINRAADDAAGLSISEKMRKQMRGLSQASANAEDGISAVQTAEGALAEVTDMLQRMNELVVQAANGTNSTTDRGYIQDEIDQLVSEIDRVAETSKFNEMYLLKGDTAVNAKKTYVQSYATTYTKYSGVNGLTIAYNYVGSDAVIVTSASVTAGSNGTSGIANSITTGEDITQYLQTGVAKTTQQTTANINTTSYSVFKMATLKTDLGTLTSSTVNGISSTQDIYVLDKSNNQVIKISKGNDLTEYLKNVNVTSDGSINYAEMEDGYSYLQWEQTPTAKNVKADLSESMLYDAEGNKVSGTALRDYFDEVGRYTGGLFTEDSAAASKKVDSATTNAFYNVASYVNMSTQEVAADLKFSLQVGADSARTNKITATIKSMSAAGLGITALKSTQAGIIDTTGDKATDAIDIIADALQTVSTQRSSLGAIQNRLEHTIKNLDNIVENTTAAESAIRDTDMAEEMVTYSNANILSQAGQSMLAQANQANQGVLSLLG